ncbi:MAG: DUF192 domain-containing protein [Deltaproteobacteria bacterium]|nr:DUF192 domain-containing protein [Deltaproteobacteria bacterium]
MKKKVLLILFFVLACSRPSTSDISAMIKIFPTNSAPLVVNAEKAQTEAELMRGLMYRQVLEKDSGMLFIFPQEQLRSFWMKNTYVDLDLIFIGGDKKITDVLRGHAFSETEIQPAHLYRYVLEVNAGFVEKNKIKAGDKVEF